MPDGPKPLPNGENRGVAPSGIKVLVVDDDPFNLLFISALLERRGIVARLAKNGAEAVQVVCAAAFDIVFMDIQMPVLDGMLATSQIRHHESMHSRPQVPVVAYSNAKIQPALLKACGINDVLAKPCSDDELDACMARWCPDFVPRSPCDGDGDAEHAAAKVSPEPAADPGRAKWWKPAAF